MNILITGAAGFIGFHVAKSLLERGDAIVCIDNFNDYYDPQVKEDRNKILLSYDKYKVYRIDIADYDALKKICSENKIDKICHLAAQAGVPYSLKNPFAYERTNVLGTLNIFQAARECGIPQVVFASSSSVYGANEKFPSSEDDRVDNPISLYAATKKSTELMAHAYSHLFGLKITGLRFFNVYGEFGRPDMMAWIFTENIINGKPINLNNEGNTWKDYTYVGDISRGVIAALDNPLNFEIVNLGNHTPMHLKKCLEIIENETGKKAVIINKPLQPGDVTKSYADVSKAKKLFGWEPTTKMEEGLPRFVKWYKQYKGLDKAINDKTNGDEKMKEIKTVAIVGLGYVGLPLAVALSKHFSVIGFDVNEKRINNLQNFHDYSGEVSKEELSGSGIIFSKNPAVLKEAQFIIVCVPTPVDKHNKPDMYFVESASKVVGENLSRDAIVVFESTVYPGATEETCVPIMEKCSGLRCGPDFKIGYSPERITPGDAEHSIHKVTKIVSGMDQETLDAVDSVYSKITKTHRAQTIKVAEAAKVIENVQRDLNIALMNELAIIFDKMGVEVSDVLEAAGTKWNFHKYHPGLVGGHCIGVDPYYLTYKAEGFGYHSDVILAGRRINDDMHKFYAHKIIRKMSDAQNRNILVLGLTFKPNVTDYRNSRVKHLIQELKDYKLEVYAYDPYLEKEIVEKEFSAKYLDPYLEPEKIISEIDLVVLAVEHSKLLELVKDIKGKEIFSLKKAK